MTENETPSCNDDEWQRQKLSRLWDLLNDMDLISNGEIDEQLIEAMDIVDCLREYTGD